MSRVTLKAWGMALSAILVTVPLGACAVSNSQRAAQEIKRMKAEHYFANQTQAEFVTAIGRGDLERARRLLQDGAQVDAVGSEGMTALFWAVLKQNIAGFSFLLEQGANPDTVTRWAGQGREQWASALEMAAIQKDPRYLKTLLDAGADPNNIINGSEQTAIYIALLNRRYENASLLIEKGADINHQSRSLKTPINTAVSSRNYVSALFLIKRGADPRIKNRWGFSAIDITKQFGKAGTVIGSEDETAYYEFVAELKRRGLWGD